MSNHITIHGNVGKDPEVRVTTSGKSIVEFTVADTYGEDQNKKTTWHNVVVFGDLGENCAKSLTKGCAVIIVGRYEQDEYTKKDGTKGKTVKIIVDEIGPSLRWGPWLKDSSEKTVRMVQEKFGAVLASDEEPF